MRIVRFFRSLRLIDVLPALALALYGAAWIVLHASQGIGYTHSVFQAVALSESVAAILLVRRKPLASLFGILVAYLLFDLEPLTLPPALFALATLATIGGRRVVVVGFAATAAAAFLMPLLHSDPETFLSAAWHLTAVTGAVLVGLFARNRAPHTQATVPQKLGVDA